MAHPIEIGGEVSQPNRAIQELEALLTDPMFEAGYVTVQAVIDTSVQAARLAGKSDESIRLLIQKLQEEKRIQVFAIRNEVALRKDDPTLWEAFGVWGQSPNASCGRGPEGKGYNAGVVHYFEYRAVGRNKARRLNNFGDLNIQGFIDFSLYLQSLVDQPDSRINTAVGKSAQIRDEQGQRRLFLLTQGNWLVVGFQRLGDRMRIISAGIEEKPERFDKRVREEVESLPEKDTRLNRLGHGRVLVQTE